MPKIPWVTVGRAIGILLLSLHVQPAFAASDKPRSLPPQATEAEWFQYALGQIDLNSNQRLRFQQIMEAYQDRSWGVRQKLQDNFNAMYRLSTGPGFDEDDADRLSAERGALTAQMAREWLRTRRDVHDLLTPPQRRQFLELHRRWKQQQRDWERLQAEAEARLQQSLERRWQGVAD